MDERAEYHAGRYKNQFDYAEASKVLKETLNLDGSPVAFKFCKTADESPKGWTIYPEKRVIARWLEWPEKKAGYSTQLSIIIPAWAAHGP